MSLLKFLTVPARTRHTATIIFAHGLGDSGYGVKHVADTNDASNDLSHIKWVFPHAPIRSMTMNGGIHMPSWYDIYSTSLDGTEDEEGIQQSARSLDELVTNEVDAGTPQSRIVLGGFSQGGTMSVYTGLTGERKLGGIVCLGGRVPIRYKFKELAADHAESVPIFWGHGKDDQIVRFELAVSSAQLLTEQVGIPRAVEGQNDSIGLEFHAYDGLGHQISATEQADLRSWLKRVIPKTE